MSSPFYFQWHITDVCNLRCRHCYQDNFTLKNDLDWNGLKTVCDNIFDALNSWNKKGLITLTGGEPLVKKELIPLLEYLNEAKEIKELNIISNITLMDDRKIDELKKFKKLKKIKFSLEGITPEINDSIRGKGTFKTIIKNFELLKSKNVFEVDLMFTLLKSNLKEVPKIFSFAKKNGLDGFILERFIPLGQSMAMKKEVLSKDDWKNLVELLIDLCQVDCNLNDILHLKAFWVKFHPKSRIPSLLGAPCTVGIDGLCIMPNADVYPCRRLNVPIGNLLKNDLTDIWENSDVLFALRKKYNLKGKCSSCNIQYCRGCRALAYAFKGDYLKEDVQCWHED
ncbi:MAG: radical SAM protein [Candidatus Omnitrophica bacterium]|nr:radical SAM protein [Candidatus Omnitrophota bacterium]